MKKVIFLFILCFNAHLLFAVVTPPAPGVTGTFQYCQFVGPFIPVTVVTTITGTPLWYTVSTGGVGSSAEPIPSINVVGVYHYWVSQVDSGMESSRTPVTITVHPKPTPPIIWPQIYCQFEPATILSATPSGIGDILLWYGPGVTSAYTTAPTPNTSIAPDTIRYFVSETTTFGCVSDSSVDAVIIIAMPCNPSLGAQEITNGQKVTVYPNPNNGIFTIEGSIKPVNDENVSFSITNMFGQVVYKSTIVAKKERAYTRVITDNNLPNGVYMLSLMSDKEIVTSRFVIGK